MKALLIAYSFPPLWEAQSIRWYYLSRELAKAGFKIDVLTISAPFYDNLDLHENIRIFRISPGILERILYRVKSFLKTEPVSVNNGSVKNQTSRDSFLLIQLKKCWRQLKKLFTFLMLGDIRNEWFPLCLQYIKKNIDISRYDCLITSHEPIVDCLLGLKIKKEFPQIRWIADIADPLTADYYPSFWKRWLQSVEKRVLQMADKILVTNEALREVYLKEYEIREDKIEIITQGFDLEWAQKSWNILPENSVFTLFYGGSFYHEFRDPAELFNALKELDFDFKFYLAGRNESFIPRDSKLRGKIVYLGMLPHPEVLEWETKADVLIYISNKTMEQVPGKFFEYIGSGRPILCITYNENDKTAELTKNLGIGEVSLNDKESIKNALTKLYKLWEKGALFSQYYPDKKILLPYSWQSQAEKLKLMV